MATRAIFRGKNADNFIYSDYRSSHETITTPRFAYPIIAEIKENIKNYINQNKESKILLDQATRWF